MKSRATGPRRSRLEDWSRRHLSIHAALLLAVLVVVIVASTGHFLRTAEEGRCRLARTLGRVTSASSSRAFRSGRDRLRNYLEDLVRRNEDVLYVSVEIEGRSKVVARADGVAELPDPADAEGLQPGEVRIDEVLLGQAPVREVSTLLSLPPEDTRRGVLRLGLSLADERSAAFELMLVIAGGGIVIAILALLLLRYASIHLARPVRELSNDFSSLLEHTPLGLVMEDERGHVLRASRAAEAWLGGRALEKGGIIRRLVQRESETGDEQSGTPDLNADGEVSLERTMVLNGRERTLSITCFTIQSGASLHNCALFLDVTDRRRLEERLLDAHRMETVGQFAGGVAHDFNNVMAAIQGYAEMLRAAAEPGSVGESHADKILEACGRGADLARRLLDFGRGARAELTRIDFAELLRDFEEFLRRLLPPAVELDVQAPRSPLFVRGDGPQLERVLMNLVSNARDAISGRGTIRVRVEEVHLEGSNRADLMPGDYVALSVTDDGRGMSATELEYAFDSFFTSGQGERGTGLGLAISSSIVRRHRGAIEVESVLGEGSTFRVYLPRASGAVVSTREPEPEPELRSPSLHGARVALAEDDSQVRELVRATLEDGGAEVFADVDGRAALDRIRRECDAGSAPDVVLADVAMPHLSGIELRAELAVLAPDLPVVLMTGESSRYPELAGCENLLTKPFRRAELERALAQAVGGEPVR